MGVTAMRRLTTAWKSVPGMACPDGGGPPIQKYGMPRGSSRSTSSSE